MKEPFENDKIQLTFEIEQEVFSAIIGMSTEMITFGNTMVEYYENLENHTHYTVAQLHMWMIFVAFMKTFIGVYILGDADIFSDFMDINKKFYKTRMKEKMDSKAAEFMRGE